MSKSRQRRRVAPRRAPVRPREELIEERENIKPTTFIQKFQNLSPNTQIYYVKITTGLLLGSISSALYMIPEIASNWFFLPIIGLIIDVLIVRGPLKIDETSASWVRLILSGTITLFVSFIVASSLLWMLLFANIPQYLN
ncbi:MAG: hypothetical protein HeimC3_14440 [Candidatus Heimdallarchaeota archaeon LC_3]|nr:MAG: hypothetical protein HeimC3_14440 [Candidatus Heimdallarchaeota archaeon LC_3]